MKKSSSKRVKSLLNFIVTFAIAMTFILGSGLEVRAADDYPTTSDELKVYIKNHVKENSNQTGLINDGLPSSVFNKLKISAGSENATYRDDSSYNSVVRNFGNDSSPRSYYIYWLDSKEEKFMKDIKNNSNYETAQNKVNDIETELDLSADTAGASDALSGVVPMISLIAGFIIILLTAMMLVFTAIDCVYIAYPAFRNKCEDAKASGNKFQTKTNSNGETSLRWVTDDAQYAIDKGTEDPSQNKWMIYLKRRLVSYVMLAIVIYMFFTGNITLIIQVAIKAVSGLMNVISGFGS
jgi:hypothetical protein